VQRHRLPRVELQAHRLARLRPVHAVGVGAAGWTESFEEVDDGIWGAAAAVRAGTDVVAALGAAGPIYRLEPPQRRQIITAVRSAAAQLSAALN
jgi:DNA-binding IclR family transcriptional regulator